MKHRLPNGFKPVEIGVGNLELGPIQKLLVPGRFDPEVNAWEYNVERLRKVLNSMKANNPGGLTLYVPNRDVAQPSGATAFDVLNGAEDTQVRFHGGLVSLFPDSRLVTVGPNKIELPRRQFDMLHYLGATPGIVKTSGELWSDVWHREDDVNKHTIEMNVYHVRRATELQTIIKNHRGVGFSVPI